MSISVSIRPSDEGDTDRSLLLLPKKSANGIAPSAREDVFGSEAEAVVAVIGKPSGGGVSEKVGSPVVAAAVAVMPPLQLSNDDVNIDSGESIALGAVLERCRRWYSGPLGSGWVAGTKYSTWLCSWTEVAGDVCGVE